MVGLTYEETTEFLQLQDDREKSSDQTKRYLALDERREAAKFKRMADEHIERTRAK